MATITRSFQLTDDDQRRLAALQAEVGHGCSMVHVLRHGLIALQTLVAAGYSFRSAPGADVIRHLPDGTMRFYSVDESAGLVPSGAIWTESTD